MKILKTLRALSYYIYYRLKYGITIRFNSSDLSCFNQIFVYKDYALDAVFKPRLIIDGGANVGYSSIFFSIMYPRAKIIAIEPDKGNYRVLKKNIKRFKNIIPVNAGLWHEEANLDTTNPYGCTMGFVTEKSLNNTKNTIKGVTINSLLKEGEKIDVLKLDIEGSERELFSSNYLE